MIYWGFQRKKKKQPRVRMHCSTTMGNQTAEIH